MNILLNFFILLVSLFVLIEGANIATKRSVLLAQHFNMSKYLIGFIVVAIISILPETFISINSSLRGIPELGLGTLFGSNIADLTLVFAIIIWISNREIKLTSKILNNIKFYPFIMLFPIFLGMDGYFSRIDGALLIVVGVLFYAISIKASDNEKNKRSEKKGVIKNLILLLVGMIMLLFGANYTVTSASNIATFLNISPVLIGIFIVGLGTTMPELFFSLKAMKNKNDTLAVGDILGTVLADATIVVGILAIINPFLFPQKIIYTTGIFMVLASFLTYYFMRTGKTISKKESFILFAFWLTFVLFEIFMNNK